MIEIRENGWYHGVGFVEPSNNPVETPFDIMLFIYRMPLEDGTLGNLKMTYRFRYYHSPDPFDLQDKKSWYSFESKPIKSDEELQEYLNQILQASHLMMAMTASKNKSQFYYYEFPDPKDGKTVMEYIKDNPPPFMHTRSASSPEEYKEVYGEEAPQEALEMFNKMKKGEK